MILLLALVIFSTQRSQTFDNLQNSLWRFEGNFILIGTKNEKDQLCILIFDACLKENPLTEYFQIVDEELRFIGASTPENKASFLFPTHVATLHEVSDEKLDFIVNINDYMLVSLTRVKGDSEIKNLDGTVWMDLNLNESSIYAIGSWTIMHGMLFVPIVNT